MYGSAHERINDLAVQDEISLLKGLRKFKIHVQTAESITR